ncbi:hypothetical protein A0J61_00647 [Choanephora cucurbitarum]|uniref:Uncharacterized protein n=1 Tax=Choanephora cucurbitarum TaxID=101091 RepID=A0A1C7NV22_9FUNG|nr:hypothetical protein A0J61_00647 [Choanephora cucurbitarum]
MSCSTNKAAARYNQTRLAAVSNYKLALITFTSPNHTTLRRTALIKNLVHTIYERVPVDALEGMVRWELFKPEALEFMTQSKIEAIVQHYLRIIQMTQSDADEQDQQYLYSSYEGTSLNSFPPLEQEQEVDDDSDYYASLFCISDTNITSMDSVCSIESDFDEESWSNEYGRVRVNHSSNKPSRRISLRASLPPVIDPQLTYDISAITLASDLMNLFDMDFNVDLSLPFLRRYEFTNDASKIESNSNSTLLHNVFNAYEIKEELESTKKTKNKSDASKIDEETKSNALQQFVLSASQSLLASKTKPPKPPHPKIVFSDQDPMLARPIPLPKTSISTPIVLVPPQRSSSLSERKALPIPGNFMLSSGSYRSSSLSNESLPPSASIPHDFACLSKSNSAPTGQDDKKKKKKHQGFHNPLKKIVKFVKKSNPQQEMSFMDHQDALSYYSKSISSSNPPEEIIPHTSEAPIKHLTRQFLLFKDTIASNIHRQENPRSEFNPFDSDTNSNVKAPSVCVV